MRQLTVIFFALLMVGCFSSSSQNKQVLYGLDEAPQSLLLNPGGRVTQKMHFGIPFLSQIHLSGGATGLSIFDIFGETGEDINNKIERKIFEMSNSDFFVVNQQLELFNFGWRSKKDFYFSGGLYQELDMMTYFPRDLAILAWNGNANYLDYPFDLGEINTTADLLTVYHFGVNKEITDNLTLGVRAKIYSSLLNYRSTNNRGTFTTRLADPSSNNIYEHRLDDANVLVQTSGIASLQDNFSASQLLGRAFFGGNLGFGLDLGGTYDINSQWTATASVLDFGVISHSKDVESYRASGSYVLDGIELLFPPLSQGEETFPYYENLENEIEEAIPIDTLNTAYSQWRPTQINAGLAFNFGERVAGGDECDCLSRGKAVKRAQAIGVQYFSVFRSKGPQMAGTLYYYRRLWDFLSAKATYTVDPFSNSNVGLGIVGDLGRFNFFIAMDNILRYENIAKAKSVSLQLGFNIKIHEDF